MVDVLGGLRVGIYVWEMAEDDRPASMRLVYANPASAMATGVAVESVVGRTMREAFPESETAAAVAEVALGGEGRDLGDVVYRDERVSERTFSVRVFPLPGRRAAVAFNDVSKERSAESRALEVLESMSDAFYILDHEWRYTYVNPAGERLWRANNPGRSDLPFAERASNWEVSPDLVGTPLYEDFQRAAREKVTVEGEYRLPGRAGQPKRWNSIRIYPNRNGLSVYVQDITERKQLEEKLLQSQKLEVVGQLASGLAHDFNNLLTVIDGYGALAATRIHTDPSFVEKALKEIGQASTSATALTAKLTSFSRTRMSQRTVVDVNDLVLSAVSLVNSLIGANIEIHTSLDPDAGNVVVDGPLCQQVFVNLFINARDAMPDGGNIYVETHGAEPPGASEADLGSALITVRDDGAGMDKQTLEQIFEPFFTTKPVGMGTGLGLPTSRDAITANGGTIDANSKLGEGTTFTVSLPRTARRADNSPAAAELLLPGNGERLLIVDDDEAIRRMMVDALTESGYDVTAAADAAEALQACARHQFSLMVTDTVMPGDDGTTLARTAIASQPHLKVLHISGYTPKAADHYEIAGIQNAFLPKPFDGQTLARHIRALLDRE
jgi:nitrogen-specific signal transduction histidine kinase